MSNVTVFILKDKNKKLKQYFFFGYYYLYYYENKLKNNYSRLVDLVERILEIVF